jgi:phenylpyruvate C(3)-methyltransferase
MKQSSAKIFNDFLVTAIIGNFVATGLFTKLHEEKSISVSVFCKKNSLEENCIRAFLIPLVSYDIVRLKGDLLKPGKLFPIIYKEKGLYEWLIKGYGHAWDHLIQLATSSNQKQSITQWKKSLQRNEQAIATAGKDYGAQLVDVHVNKLISKLLKKSDHKVLADLGCGSANRLLSFLTKFKHLKGIGIDISREVILENKKKIRTLKIDNKLQMIQADVTQLSHRKEFTDVTILMSFFMGHDLWPYDQAKKIFKNIRVVFPNISYFLLCDTIKNDSADENTIFSWSFEITHTLMRQYIPTNGEWQALFEDTGWECKEIITTDLPLSYIYLLTPQK